MWSTAPAPPSPASSRQREPYGAVDDRGVHLTLPAGYLDAGQVTHGYAITGHKAQGLTCEHTYTLGTETLYREWGNVAMSRDRLTNQLYHGPVDVGVDGLHHHVHHDDAPDLTSRLRRSRAQPPIAPEIAQLASDWRATLRWLASNAVRQQPHLLAEHHRTSPLPSPPDVPTFLIDRALGRHVFAHRAAACGYGCLTLADFYGDEQAAQAASDITWLAEVGGRDLVILTRDGNLDVNEQERLALARYRHRVVWIGP